MYIKLHNAVSLVVLVVFCVFSTQHATSEARDCTELEKVAADKRLKAIQSDKDRSENLIRLSYASRGS